MKEDGIDLDNKREGDKGDKLPADHRYRVAEDDEAVVKQKLICASLPVIEDHVDSVIKKVAD